MQLAPHPLLISPGVESLHCLQSGVLVVFGLPSPVLRVTPERVDGAHRRIVMTSRLYLGIQAGQRPEPMRYEVALIEGGDLTLTIAPGEAGHPLAYAVTLGGPRGITC